MNLHRPAVVTALLLTIVPLISLGQYQVGDTVGDFSLKDVDGRTRRLKSFQNKVILLNFFTTW